MLLLSDRDTFPQHRFSPFFGTPRPNLLTAFALPAAVAGVTMSQVAQRLKLVRDAVLYPIDETVALRFLRRLRGRQVDDVVQVGNGPCGVCVCLYFWRVETE